MVFTGYDDARRAAAAADAAVLAGDQLGPLHGVPTLIKDLFDFKPGWTSTFGGVPALADQVIDAYCMFAERVEHAGAILVGKTNSPVMGMRGTCDNPLFGPSRNPFDLTKNTGRLIGRQRRGRRRRPRARSRRAPMRAARSASQRHGAASTA